MEDKKYHLMRRRRNHMQKYSEMSCILIICLIIIGFSDGSTQNISKPGIVKTDAGMISGFQQDRLWVYLGIPFAAPRPETYGGDRPLLSSLWDGVKETKVYSPACTQPISEDPNLTMIEDCLYLNVRTPAKPLTRNFRSWFFSMVEHLER